jgi:hypothetical protein
MTWRGPCAYIRTVFVRRSYHTNAVSWTSRSHRRDVPPTGPHKPPWPTPIATVKPSAVSTSARHTASTRPQVGCNSVPVLHYNDSQFVLAARMSQDCHSEFVGARQGVASADSGIGRAHQVIKWADTSLSSEWDELWHRAHDDRIVILCVLLRLGPYGAR